jgi:pyruvate/2-oxoglutarate dehydrogenase complex dihydrolipoamide dehydrogenase (E3) component
MNERNYDAIIIGTGQGGKPLALALANAGWETAVIERKDVGGTCVNVGCTPTKTMVASARVAYLARRASDYGVRIGEVGLDLGKVRERKQAIVERFRDGGRRSIERTDHLALLFGEAEFTGPKSIRVRMNDGTARQLSAPHIFINAGCRPAMLRVEGIETVPVLDSTSIMELTELPEHLLILGGGYIGLEFGQMFRRFGSRVTIIQRGPQLLGREDADVAEAVASILREDGIEVLLNATLQRIEKRNAGRIHLSIHTGEGERAIEGTHLLAAAGRVPNTDSLALPAAGVETDKHGFIRVNNRLETNVAGVYALGDIKGGPQFTHISYDDFRILRANLLESGKATTDDRYVPYTVYIDPQLGRVGLSETEAREKGLPVKVAKMPMNYVARALEVDESRGFMKVVLDAETDRILGCAMLGIEGGEVMSMIQIAMMGGLTGVILREATFAHPTLAESLNNLFNV